MIMIINEVKTRLTEDELIIAYENVFTKEHSRPFMTAEITDLLFEDTYWFMERPKHDWYEKLMTFLKRINFDLSLLKMNKELIEHKS